MFAINKIIHPTDFSDLSRPAFELACTLASRFGAELIVCHVSPPPAAAVIDGIAVHIPMEETAQLSRRLEQIKPDDAAIRVTHELLRGDPAGEVLRLAGDTRANLIVMGTHGRSGLGRMFLGSVADAIVRGATCPVVTVKAPS